MLCHGTFDLLHAGHIEHLQKSRAKGDLLIVTITADQFVNKGPDRPVFSHSIRANSIAALECVDYVGVNYHETAVDLIKKLQPSIYCKGFEYKLPQNDLSGNIDAERAAIEVVGGKIDFSDGVVFSSSHLLNSYFDLFDEGTRSYLNEFKLKFSCDFIIEAVNSLKDLRVLVVGEAIIDEYHYVDPLGTTGKGTALAVEYRETEKYAGGALAVANHVANFSDNVSLVTSLGRLSSDENFVKDSLKPDIVPIFFYDNEAVTIRKERFVDSDLKKYFEVYFSQKPKGQPSYQSALEEWLLKHLVDFDLVLVADYGNGFIPTAVSDILSLKSRFVAVNTQINSGNRGYHSITKYKKANFIALNEPELRLACHNKNDPLNHLSGQIIQRLSADALAVTKGKDGVTIESAEPMNRFSIPAFSSKVLDRVGAGDAFLALASMLLCKKMHPELAGFVGSVAAAMNVQTVCNSVPVTKVGLQKYISTLLK